MVTGGSTAIPPGWLGGAALGSGAHAAVMIARLDQEPEWTEDVDEAGRVWQRPAPRAAAVSVALAPTRPHVGQEWALRVSCIGPAPSGWAGPVLDVPVVDFAGQRPEPPLDLTLLRRLDRPGAHRLAMPAACGWWDEETPDGTPLRRWFWTAGTAGSRMSLDDVARSWTVPGATVARWLLDILEGLGHLHAHGVLHLDVSPQNVLVDRRRVRLGDPDTLLDERHPLAVRSLLGGAGALLAGTPRHAAPWLRADWWNFPPAGLPLPAGFTERWFAERLGVRADLYAALSTAASLLGRHHGDPDPVRAELGHLVSGLLVQAASGPEALPATVSDAGLVGELEEIARFWWRDPAGAWIVDPRPRIWNVRDRRAGFTGRAAVLDTLRSALAPTNPAPVVLHAPGGMGKSTLANEFLHRHAADFSAVWWIDAAQPLLVDQQVAEFAARVDAAPPGADVATGVEAARQWWREHPDWIVVLDNLGDPHEFGGLAPEGRGAVLVTTRSEAWSGGPGSLSLEVFSREESQSFLRVALTGDVPTADLADLAEALGDLPLGLAQAAAFITSTHTTIAEYLTALRADPSVLRRGRPAEYPDSLSGVVTVAVDALDAIAPVAVDLLRMLASYAPAPVPIAWLTGVTTAEVGDDLAAALRSVTRTRALTALLARHGLVQTTSSRDLSLHRLTRAVVLDQAPTEGRAASRAAACAVLNRAAPGETDEPSDWPTWGLLAPHLAALVPATAAETGLRRLALDLARVLLVRGDSGAEAYATSLAENWGDLLGPAHPDTLVALRRQAHGAHLRGDYERAREITAALVPRCRAVLGENAAETVAATNALGAALHGLGRYAEAAELQRGAWRRLADEFGEDDPAALGWAGNHARGLYSLGRFEEALKVDEHVLTHLRPRLGPEHPDVLRVETNLALDLLDLGRDLARAAELAGHALDVFRERLGDRHPETLLAMVNLARVRRAAGDFAGSRKLDESAWSGYRATLGERHPEAVWAAVLLARDLRDAGEPAAALLLDALAFDTYVAALGPDHPETLWAAAGSAEDLAALGRPEAGEALADVATRRARVLGPDHPLTRASAARATDHSPP